MLAKNTVEPASYLYKFCLDKTPTSIPALLGQAYIYFFSGNYRLALQAFQSILKSNPQFNEVRAAIGYCFHRLGYEEMALKAFNRVLQVDPENEAALLAVGFIQLSQESQLQNGLLQMKKVYELNKFNAVAQIHLANHFFFKKDLVKAKTLAEGALTYAPSDKIKAEAFFILAKISHVSGNFSEALGNYQLSTKLAPEFLPSLFGLGQCFLARGDLDGALMMFERVLDGEPNCPEVIRLMALIFSSKIAKTPSTDTQTRKELTEKALPLIKLTFSLFPKDEIILQCGAVLYESIDPLRAIELYKAANAQESENFAVLNNFVVLKQSLVNECKNENSILESRELLKKALKLSEAFNQSHQNEAIRLFLKFNEARLVEKENLIEAENLYREILKLNSNFSFAHLRLGIICHQRGQFAEGADHFKDVLGSDELNRDAWNCIAATHLKQKAFTPARKSFERVLQNIDKNDPYALVALGNIYIELARQDKSHKHTEEYHKRAGEFFGKALNIDKGNIYAAQGLGLIFADLGMASEAKEIFTQVRATQNQNNKIPIDTTLNLAHSLTELGQYAGAAILYSSVIDSVKNVVKQKNTSDVTLSSGKIVSLLLFLCRSRYLLAGEFADYQSADLAIEDARKALELLPNDQPLKFNLGLLLQIRAKAIIQATSETTFEPSESSELLNSAIGNIQKASEIFKEIISGSEVENNSNSTKMDPKLVNSRLSLCPELLKNIQERLKTNEKSIKEQCDRLEQLKIQRNIQQERDISVKIEKEAQERQKFTEIETSRRELALKMKETEEKVKASAGRSNVKFTSKDEDEDENSSDDNESEDRDRSDIAMRKKKKRVKIVHLEASGDEDNDLDGITGKGRRRIIKGNGKGSSAPLLSKEFISSEDEIDEKAPLYDMNSDDMNE